MAKSEAQEPLEPEPGSVMQISVVACLAPRQVQEWELQLPEGATVAQALHACGLATPDGSNDLGVWGRRCELSQALKSGDRLEL